jgi:DNA polymerase V
MHDSLSFTIARGIAIHRFQESPGGASYPLFLSGVSAGFPSPAEDYIDKKLSLDEYLIQNKTATFFVQVSGDSMINAGIHDGSLIVVDRSLQPQHNDIVMAIVNNEFLIKRLNIQGNTLLLLAENNGYEPVKMDENNGDCIWGVVISCIQKFR